jgi:hypothetical protein
VQNSKIFKQKINSAKCNKSHKLKYENLWNKKTKFITRRVCIVNYKPYWEEVQIGFYSKCLSKIQEKVLFSS